MQKSISGNRYLKLFNVIFVYLILSVLQIFFILNFNTTHWFIDVLYLLTAYIFQIAYFKQNYLLLKSDTFTNIGIYLFFIFHISLLLY